LSKIPGDGKSPKTQEFFEQSSGLERRVIWRMPYNLEKYITYIIRVEAGSQ
jgi:hypothetical protein